MNLQGHEKAKATNLAFLFKILLRLLLFHFYCREKIKK
jgi:hypothetical protein